MSILLLAGSLLPLSNSGRFVAHLLRSLCNNAMRGYAEGRLSPFPAVSCRLATGLDTTADPTLIPSSFLIKFYEAGPPALVVPGHISSAGLHAHLHRFLCSQRA